MFLCNIISSNTHSSPPPSDHYTNMPSKAAAITRRRFEAFRSMRVDLETSRRLKSKMIEEKRCLPHIVKKLCPNPTNPDEDCFAMTLDVGPPKATPIASTMTKPKIDGLPHCSGTRPFLHIKTNVFSEALIFYEAAFGAEVVHIQKIGEKHPTLKRKSRKEDTFISEAVLKIGSQTYAICDSDMPQPYTPDGAHFSLLTDDVGSAVDKALKAGAALSGKLVQVYSKCRMWCELVKVDDPYGNVWIIHSRLCPSCLQSFVLLV